MMCSLSIHILRRIVKSLQPANWIEKFDNNYFGKKDQMNEQMKFKFIT